MYIYIYRPSKPLDKPLDKPLVVFMNPFGCHQSMCVCLMPIAIVLGIPTKHDIIGIDVPILFGLPFFMGWMTINIHKPKRTISWHGPNPWMAHLFQSMAQPPAAEDTGGSLRGGPGGWLQWWRPGGRDRGKSGARAKTPVRRLEKWLKSHFAVG